MDYQNIPELQTKIVLEEKVSLAYAAILAENALYRFDPRVREGVLAWLNGTLTDSFAVAEVPLKEIREYCGGSLFQALCILDIFLKNGEFVKMVEWVERSDFIDVEYAE